MSGQDAPPRPAAPPTSEASFPASAMDFLDKDDNPFVVQRDLILSQSVAAGFAASTPPGQTPTTESGGGGGTRADWLSWQSTETTSTTNSSLWRSVGGSGSTVRGWGEIAAGTGGRFASLRTSMSAGSMKSPWSSREWSTKPEPKNHSPAASVTISTEQANLEQRQRSQTQQKVELLPMSFFDVSSSDDDDDGSDGSGDDGGGSVASAPPNIAEGKNAHNFRRVGNGTRTGVVGVTSDADTDIDDDDHDVRSSLPRPSSDGGWPETKRCTPPNLKFRSRSRSRSSPPSEKRTVGVDRKGKASTTALARAPGNTNRRTFHANGVHSATGGNRHSPTAPMGNDGGGGGNGDRNTSSGSSSDSMFDIDHRETNADRTTTESRISRIKTGLKRGRTPPVRSPGDDRSYYSSDNGNNDSTVDGVDNADAGGGGSMFRGGKTGRNERYPAPVPRRPRSSSLSLSPSRFTAFDGDCNSADDTPSAVASLSPKSAAGGRNGNDSYLASSRRRRRRRSSRSRETVAGRRGVKRGLEEENLHDGIEAMRVASDDELSSVRSNAGGIGGVRRGKERMGGAVERGDRAAAWSANCEDQEEEHSEDDDYLDDEDLKPNISNPTWLGPFETYDLGAGESINPSINRYLKEYQREGVRELRTTQPQTV